MELRNVVTATIDMKFKENIQMRFMHVCSKYFFLDKRHWFKIFGWVILLTFLFIILLFHYIVLFFEYVHSTVALIFIPSDISLSCSIYWMFVFASHFNNNMFMQIYNIVQFAVEANALNEICTKYLRAFQ